MNDTDSFNKLVSIFCVSRKENLRRKGCTNTERAYFVTWFPQGYAVTEFQSLLEEIYLRIPPARSTIGQGREGYQKRGFCNYKGVNGRSWISTAMRNQIRKLFANIRIISLGATAARTRVRSSIVRNVASKELKLHPYKLQMSTPVTKEHKRSRFNSAQNRPTELKNDRGFLDRIVVSAKCKFSLPRKVNKQNCWIWGTECPN